MLSTNLVKHAINNIQRIWKSSKSFFSQILFKIARHKLTALLIGKVFAYMSWLLPVERLHETNLVIAFQHPKPSYKIHILIVPKKEIQNLLAMGDTDLPIIDDVIKVAQLLVKQHKMEEKGYRLLVNGGVYQEVGQLHFHLVSNG